MCLASGGGGERSGERSSKGALPGPDTHLPNPGECCPQRLQGVTTGSLAISHRSIKDDVATVYDRV